MGYWDLSFGSLKGSPYDKSGRNFIDAGMEILRPKIEEWNKRNLGNPLGPPMRNGKLPALNVGEGNEAWWKVKDTLPPFYRTPYPANAGLPYLHESIRNYMTIPGAEGRLASNLEGTELKYNRAENVARESSYGSGAAGSGVQRLARAELPVARAGEQAGNLYEQETWLAEQQMERLASLLFPWMSQYNQAFGTSRGRTLPSTGSGFEDWMSAATSVLDSLQKSGWLSGKNKGPKNAGPTDEPDWYV